MLTAALLSLTAALSATKHYGIVFDAGSSGTRIHVYTWQTGGGGAKNDFDLVSDDLLKIKPGLSAYKDRPSDAGASLAPLIEYARSKIPADAVASTPMFLMATAGLRMVGEAAKDAILGSVATYLGTTGYLFRPAWATVLDGRDEGLFGWVTVNYLLNALYPGGAEPAGIIDLGGGSVQIVFPTSAATPPAAAGLAQALEFGGRRHPLYVKSHLGFGLDAARTSLLDLLVTRSKEPVTHPCLPRGATLTHKGVGMKGTADHHKCKKLTKRLFGGDDHCPYGKHMCSFMQVYQVRAGPPRPNALTVSRAQSHCRASSHKSPPPSRPLTPRPAALSHAKPNGAVVAGRPPPTATAAEDLLWVFLHVRPHGRDRAARWEA